MYVNPMELYKMEGENHMAQLNFGHLEYVITNRLRGEFRNPVAERLLKDRCLNAVNLRNINAAGLFNQIVLPQIASYSPRIIRTSEIIEVLKNTGVMDLVYLCINSQYKEEDKR